MSKTMKLHPVTIIISLLVFEKLFGIVGMIFAAPVVAVIKVIFTYFNDKYELSGICFCLFEVFIAVINCLSIHIFANVLNELGVCYKNLGEYAKAEGCLEKSLNLARPKNRDAIRINLSNLYLISGFLPIIPNPEHGTSHKTQSAFVNS